MNEQNKIVREAIIDSLVKLRMVHEWQKDWYKKEDVLEYISVYYKKIRNIIKTVNRRYWELTRCADCGIYLITSCSNRGRKDIRCPFGCRDSHKKKSSNKRSQSYYKTKKGGERKRKHNENRYRQSKKASREIEKVRPPEYEKKGSFVRHVRFIVSLIEGRFISWKEIKNILLEYFKKWRQHPLEYWLEVCNMAV